MGSDRSGWRCLSRIAALIFLSLALNTAPTLHAIESISEPDTIIVGQVRNLNTEKPIPEPYIVKAGVVEWKIQSADDPETVFTYRAPIEQLPDEKYYFRFTISHQAAISTFRVEASSLPLGFSEEEYNHLDITVDGEPATIEGGADTLSLSQENRGSLLNLNLEVDFVPLDSDGDGIPDWWEERYHDPNDDTTPDPEFPDANKNGDMDALTNLQEYQLGTDPNVADSETERHGTMEPGKVDIHKFTLDVPSVVTIYTVYTGDDSVDTVGTLLDEAMEELNDPAEDDDAGDGRNFKIVKGLAAGTYFVKVASNPGPYESGDYTLFIEPVDGVFRPDFRSGKKAGSFTHKGNNLYAPTVQVVEIEAKKGRPAKVYLSIENDGDVPDNFRAKITRLSRKEFGVSYRVVGGGAITAGLQMGSHLASLEPGQIQRIVGKIRSKKFRRKVTILGRIQSGNDANLIDWNRIKIQLP